MTEPTVIELIDNMVAAARADIERTYGTDDYEFTVTFGQPRTVKLDVNVKNIAHPRRFYCFATGDDAVFRVFSSINENVRAWEEICAAQDRQAVTHDRR